MKAVSCIALLAVAASTLGAVELADVERRLKQMPATHPRLFVGLGGESKLKRNLEGDPARAAIRKALMARADAILTESPVERVLIGRRLLDKSRTCLSRVMHLGLAWRVTGDRKYADRARREMLAAAAFTDWNPSHFLDVAEMTTALGVGYDWLYAVLSEDDRRTIRTAIVEKGLKPSLKADSWTRAAHNWNQVCNAGMAVGAIAVAESEPSLAAQMVARAVNTVPLAMHEYAPDGAYPEGASYWNYGTTFNVILLSALESALGTDFGLAKQPGFLQTADYLLHVYGPTGLPFNYSDCGSGRAGVSPAMFWFAAARRDPMLLWSEWQKLGDRMRGDRADPFLPIWMAPDQPRPAGTPALSWTGHGPTPVAFHRTSWDPEAVFVAIKGGSPSTNHAHMDIGAFVMDADGTRWADDLGMQDYNSLESKGVDLWGKGQDAGRWKVFRLGTSAHNVLMVDGAQQRYSGMARIVMSKPGRTVVNLDETYDGQLARAARGVRLEQNRTVLVQDEFVAIGGKAAAVRWAMLTRADVQIAGPGRAVLTRDGRKLELRVLEPAGVELRTYATDPPPAPTDAPNPGTRMLGFEVRVSGGAPARVRVLLVPQSAKVGSTRAEPLAGW